MSTATPSRDRFAGCLLGGALGDALGYPVEFERPGDRIVARFGGAPPAELPRGKLPAAFVSDDTQMTLFTAEGLVRAFRTAEATGRPSDAAVLAALRAAWLRWYVTQTRFGRAAAEEEGRARGLLLSDGRLYARRSPGNTCLSALQRQEDDPRLVPTPAQPANDSKGCGAVMRAAPIGLVAPDRATAWRWARDTGALTHGHPSGYLSAAAQAVIVWDLVRGATLQAAADEALALLSAAPHGTETAAALRAGLSLAAQGPPAPAAIERLGGGWVGEEALAIAVACAATVERPAAAAAPSPEAVAAALFRAVAHGGDSDSTGAIAGNLLGAQWGLRALPPAWVATVELRDLAERLAADLHAVAVEGAAAEEEDYPAE